MPAVLADIVAEVVAVALLSAGATGLAAAGVLFEQAGVASLAAGQLALGAWYVYMGSLALFVGAYLLGYREVVPRVQSLLTAR